MRRLTIFALMGLMVISLLNSVYATSDLSTLGSPEISISPTSGPPGTRITITVSNIPDISKESYPYPDLYIYLPFSQSFGVTPQSQCGGEDCFPIYTHDEAVNHDFADRTVTFSLFSTTNPNPIYLNGFENSMCDVLVNGKTVERYSALCNTKDQPAGTYDIKFGWVEENAPQINYIVKTVQFTVIPGSPAAAPQEADNGNSIIQAYQNGQISESVFYSKLSALGWDSEEIRQALATIGKLPHQMGAPVPDEMQQIQGVQKASQQFNSPPSQKPIQTVQQQPLQQTAPVTTEQTADSLAPYKVDSSPQQTLITPQVQAETNPNPQNNIWTIITIVASIGAASAIGGSVFFVRHTRKVTN
ncbi:MAG: hypothetical protein KGI25_00295 [Thaumarchaeota archaeon]|nr:hypothetical protein [Nitrososphaerota archaeon]